MKNDLRKNIMTLAAVTIAAFLMALNTKTFVNTGGLYPGGITGLTILLQRIFRMTFGLTVPFSVINIIPESWTCLYWFSLYWKTLYGLFLCYDIVKQLFYGSYT